MNWWARSTAPKKYSPYSSPGKVQSVNFGREAMSKFQAGERARTSYWFLRKELAGLSVLRFRVISVPTDHRKHRYGHRGMRVWRNV